MADIGILGLPVAVSLDGTEYAPLVQGGVTKRATSTQIGATGLLFALPGSIEFVIDGGGSQISARTWGYLTVPFAAKITSASLTANAIGTMTVDIWKCTYGQFDGGVTHPVSTDSITNGTPPTITGDTKSLNSTLAGWTTNLAVTDVLAFNVPSTALNITRVTVSLNIIRVMT